MSKKVHYFEQSPISDLQKYSTNSELEIFSEMMTSDVRRSERVKSPTASPSRLRKDANGRELIASKKNLNVKIRTDPSIILVESYKIYNVNEGEGGKRKKFPCACQIY